MKKRTVVAAAIIAVVVLSLSCFVGTGFHERTDVALLNYAVSEDGTKLTFHTAILSSMGYTRGFEDRGGGVKPHYLVFYSAFGGWNSSFGAKSAFELDLAEADTEIYFNRADGGYELVLQKDVESGEWTRP